MPLITEGLIVRTFEKQLIHLTEEHLEQLEINENQVTTNAGQLTTNEEQLVINENQVTTNAGQLVINETQVIINAEQLAINTGKQGILTAGKNIIITDNIISGGVLPGSSQIKYDTVEGSSLISGLTFELNKRYEITMSSYYKQGSNTGKQIKIVIFTSATLDNKFVISAVCYTASEIIKDYTLILANASTGSLSISPAMEIVIYKVVLLD